MLAAVQVKPLGTAGLRSQVDLTSPKHVAHVSMTSLHGVSFWRSRHSPCDLASGSQLLVSLWVHKGRSSVGVSPVFLIRMISAFVGVAEVLAARRRTANRCSLDVNFGLNAESVV